MEAALQGEDPAVVKTLPFDVLLCSTGRSRGVGRLGFLKVFSIMVYMIKGKTLGMDKLNTYIDGSVA
ncbi:MAG: hypothetical protein OK454_11645 [Thaumarchaeota archaeon]|nr:hypothetical protein [Nitrososphaerota archaeon]